MRILHSPTNVGNQPWVVSRYERKLGHQSDLIINYATGFNYPADKILGQHGKKLIRDIARRLIFGITAPFKYDIFHYYFGRSILYWDDWTPQIGFPYLDLRLAKALGKKIFFTLQGCDVRLAGESNKNNQFTPCRLGGCGLYATCIEKYDQQRRAFIKNILPLCDQVFFLNPELGHYLHDGNFLPYANVDIESIEPVYPNIKRIPKIVHAPSDSAIKGTTLILEALEALRHHFEFELILVQGKTHEQALKLYRDADIAIDQVLLGWYGGVSVEWMAMGKPVLCYIRESDLKFVPKQMCAELPIQNIRPDHLVDDLAKILLQQTAWHDWGVASRRFVERWHHPAIIARALIDIYHQPQSRFNLSNTLFKG